MRISTAFIAALSALPYCAGFSNSVFLIRHGEKPADGSEGLSLEGIQRARCLVDVFSRTSPFNIGKIIAETPSANGKHSRPLQTVKPLASNLEMGVDTSCDRDDARCVADAVRRFARQNTSNVLVSWHHKGLSDIAHELGVEKKSVRCPNYIYNLIWTLKDNLLVSITSQRCPGLDELKAVEGFVLYEQL